MNQHRRMNALPEFVIEGEREGRDVRISHVLLTGWESVVFQVGDDEPEPGSDSAFSTAILAP